MRVTPWQKSESQQSYCEVFKDMNFWYNSPSRVIAVTSFFFGGRARARVVTQQLSGRFFFENLRRAKRECQKSQNQDHKPHTKNHRIRPATSTFCVNFFYQRFKQDWEFQTTWQLRSLAFRTFSFVFKFLVSFQNFGGVGFFQWMLVLFQWYCNLAKLSLLCWRELSFV